MVCLFVWRREAEGCSSLILHKRWIHRSPSILSDKGSSEDAVSESHHVLSIQTAA